MIDEKPYLPVDVINATGAQIKLKGDDREYSAACTRTGLVLFNEEGDQIVFLFFSFNFLV